MEAVAGAGDTLSNVAADELRAPFIWFGGKRRVADVAWRALGNPPNYVEPFCATLAVLLARPGGAGKIETINDLDCDIANFWRAMIASPEALAEAADWPVNEADLHARSERMRVTLPEHRERMNADPEYFDAARAGVWVWGTCTAIGGNWMDAKGKNASPRLCGWVSGNGMHAAGAMPALGHSGRGIHRPERDALIDWFRALQTRLRRVRVACGDFERVLSGAVTGESNSLKNMGMSPCAVFLDPPYDKHDYYLVDGNGASKRAREWALAHGDDPHFRIALCGYSGEHEMPASWTEHAWKAQGGHANRNAENKNAHRERIWFSPHCRPLEQQRSLFG